MGGHRLVGADPTAGSDQAGGVVRELDLPQQTKKA